MITPDGRRTTARDWAKELGLFYAASGTFAKTLANSKKNLVEKDIQLSKGLAEAAVMKLKAEFPDDYSDFVTWTGVSPLQYLVSDDLRLG